METIKRDVWHNGKLYMTGEDVQRDDENFQSLADAGVIDADILEEKPAKVVETKKPAKVVETKPTSPESIV